MNKLKSFANGLTSVLFAATIAVPTFMPAKVAAATPANLNRVPKITFTFDDGEISHRSLAADTLAKYGYSGTAYITSGCVGMTTAPNTCAADTDSTYMTWAQINELKNNYGWEIGAHTVSHPYLATTGDGQPNPLTTAQVVSELTNSKNAIAANTGISPTAFASPYGDYQPSGNPVLAEVAKLYTSHRGFADTGFNTTPWETTSVLPADVVPLNNYLIRTQQVQGNVPVSTVKGWIDRAANEGTWLVLTFHHIKANGASNNIDDYEYNNADLDQIAAYAKSKNVLNTNVSAALPLMGAQTNLIADHSFDAAIADKGTTPSTTGWTTDSVSTIKRDSNNHGSYPSPLGSAAITISATATHLFSNQFAVDPAKQYLSSTFINITNAAANAEVAFYIDEYDASGVNKNTQYKKSFFSASNPLVKTWSFDYAPTAGTAYARLQIYFSAGITGYVDNSYFFAKDGTSPTPTGSSDLNKDGKVDVLDLSTLLANWNKTGISAAGGNINGDAIVDVLDLSTLLANWSK